MSSNKNSRSKKSARPKTAEAAPAPAEAAPAKVAKVAESEKTSLSDAAQNHLKRTLESYFGIGGVKKRVMEKSEETLTSGNQLLLNRGTGNERFALGFTDTEFLPTDASADLAGRDVIINLSRLLVDAKVYSGS